MQKKPLHTARFVAAETLCNLYQSRSSLKILFDNNVEKFKLQTNERRLAMRLIYGVLRQRQTIDVILQRLSKTPIRKLNTFVHQALAVGLYQIFYLERIPDSAAVNEAVNSCKTKKVPKRLHGFVNGILRETIRQKEKNNLTQIGLTQKNGNLIYNHPHWLVNRWIEYFGEQETSRICLGNNTVPLLALRINTRLITRTDFCHLLAQAEIEHRTGCYGADSIILPVFHGSIQSIPGYDEGFFQVQDEAAQLASLLLAPFRNDGFYLDGCAGLGGKTLHLLQLAIGRKLSLYAVEPDLRRLQKLKENQRRLFTDSSLNVYKGTLQEFRAATEVRFDGILIDAPCSGTGVIGRHPDIRWNREESDLSRYQKEQLALLDEAAQLLASGGVLVYTTCSLEPEENQHVINDFLAKHPNFQLTDCREQLPETAHQFVHDNFFCPRPAATIDGFFGARMVLTGK